MLLKMTLECKIISESKNIFPDDVLLHFFSPIGSAGSSGSFSVVGVQVGEVFIGVQPLLGM